MWGIVKRQKPLMDIQNNSGNHYCIHFVGDSGNMSNQDIRDMRMTDRTKTQNHMSQTNRADSLGLFLESPIQSKFIKIFRSKINLN